MVVPNVSQSVTSVLSKLFAAGELRQALLQLHVLSETYLKLMRVLF